jgi:ribonuclease Z
MFDVVFLGTSASAPSIHRGLPAQIVLANEYRFLIDCGEGTQRQILKSGIGFRRLTRILLTHSHLDHILGLGGLISTFSRWEEGIEGLDIYGGAATLERANDLIFKVALRGAVSPMPINLIEIQAGDILLEDKNMTLSVFPVIHRGPDCYGFIFQQKDHRPFDAQKATELGIPFGPERSQLVQGESITLANGRTIQPNEVLGEPEPGVKLVFTGDVADAEAMRPYIQEADCLVCEATYLDEEMDVARQVGHLTAGEAARLARDNGVKTLILTHISRRNSERQVKQEARAIFPDTFVARDFDHYRLARGKLVEQLQNG